MADKYAAYLFHQGTNYKSYEFLGVHRVDLHFGGLPVPHVKGGGVAAGDHFIDGHGRSAHQGAHQAQGHELDPALFLSGLFGFLGFGVDGVTVEAALIAGTGLAAAGDKGVPLRAVGVVVVIGIHGGFLLGGHLKIL